MKPFYCIYNQKHGVLFESLTTLSVAEGIAKQLANENPNELFHILTLVDTAQQTDATLVYSDGIDFCQGHTNLDLP